MYCPDRHEDVTVGRVNLTIGVGLTGDNRRPAGLGEGHPGVGVTEHAQAVEEVVRVEGDLELGAGERALDGFRGLGVVAGAGFDRDLMPDGSIKRVMEALYVKSLVDPAELHWPDDAQLTAKARAALHALFGG